MDFTVTCLLCCRCSWCSCPTTSKMCFILSKLWGYSKPLRTWILMQWSISSKFTKTNTLNTSPQPSRKKKTSRVVTNWGRQSHNKTKSLAWNFNSTMKITKLTFTNFGPLCKKQTTTELTLQCGWATLWRPSSCFAWFWGLLSSWECCSEQWSPSKWC